MRTIIHGMHPVYVWCEDQAIDLKELDADVDVVVAAVGRLIVWLHHS